MASEQDAKVAAGFSLTAAIAAIAVYLQNRKVGGAELVLPDEVIRLLAGIGTGVDEIYEALRNLTITGGGQGWPANANTITALRVAINPANGVELPAIIIPSGFAMVIKAWALNPAWLWVGASLGECRNINQAFPLLPSETVTYQVQNANQLYIAGMTPAGAVTAGCFACLTVEQRKGGG